jgi:hypothetical protein
MLGEVLEDQLSIDATLPRTLFALLFRPGHLTNEYLKGRIASWVPPFRLYLATSVLFFLALSVTSRLGEFQATLTESGSGTAEPTVADALAQAIDSVRTTAGGAPADTAAPTTRRSPAESDLFFGVTLEPGEQGDTTPLADRWVVNTGFPSLDSAVLSRLRELSALPANEAGSRIVSAIIERIPTAMFILVPVFAALLKLLHVFRRRYYVEHFVFALHYHAFAFLGFLLLMIPWTPLRAVLGLWMGVYLWLAIRRVYGQGWLMTTGKWTLLNVAYFFVLVIGLLTTTVIALLLL